jgi:hypothetical protein
VVVLTPNRARLDISKRPLTWLLLVGPGAAPGGRPHHDGRGFEAELAQHPWGVFLMPYLGELARPGAEDLLLPPGHAEVGTLGPHGGRQGRTMIYRTDLPPEGARCDTDRCASDARVRVYIPGPRFEADGTQGARPGTWDSCDLHRQSYRDATGRSHPSERYKCVHACPRLTPGDSLVAWDGRVGYARRAAAPCGH